MTERKEEKKEKKEKTLEEEITAKTLLLPTEKYLKTGVHIGSRFKSGDMKKYIYKQRSDGLKVLDVQTLDERIKLAAGFIAAFPIHKVMVVSRKLYGQKAVKEFAKLTGAKEITGRFVPGSFTNPNNRYFTEPKLLIATEPEGDAQAIEEATRTRIPVIALCSTNNSTENIDFVIPVNNKGRKSLALVYWLLARETMKELGIIKKDEEFKHSAEDFEYKIKDSETLLEEEENRKETRRPFRREKSFRMERRGRSNRR